MLDGLNPSSSLSLCLIIPSELKSSLYLPILTKVPLEGNCFFYEICLKLQCLTVNETFLVSVSQATKGENVKKIYMRIYSIDIYHVDLSVRLQKCRNMEMQFSWSLIKIND